MSYISNIILNKSPTKNKQTVFSSKSNTNIKTNKELNINSLYFLVNDMFRFLSIFYSHKIISNLIPSKHNKSQIEYDNNEDLCVNDKNERILILNNLVTRRIMKLKEDSYRLYQYFNDNKLKKEMKIFQNLEIKLLVSLYIIISGFNNDEKIFSFSSNIFTEIYQGYLGISYILLNRIENSKEAQVQHEYEGILNRISHGIIKIPEFEDETFYIKQINDLLSQMIIIFIEAFIIEDRNMNIMSMTHQNQFFENKKSSIQQVLKKKKTMQIRKIHVLTDILFNLDNYSNYFILEITSNIPGNSITHELSSYNQSLLNCKRKSITLLINFDRFISVFVKNSNKKEHVLRPNSSEFIHEMSFLYNIVLYSTYTKDNIKEIIEEVDLNNDIHEVYYLEGKTNAYSCAVKELNKKGVVDIIYLEGFIDNIICNKTSNLSIFIINWKGDKNDTYLTDIKPVLVGMLHKNFNSYKDFYVMYRQLLKDNAKAIGLDISEPTSKSYKLMIKTLVCNL